jgi:hypothetical protein
MTELTTLRATCASATAVHAAIAEIVPMSESSINDLDRLAEDLGLNPWDRLALRDLLEERLQESIDIATVMRPDTVADLVVALDYRRD